MTEGILETDFTMSPLVDFGTTVSRTPTTKTTDNVTGRETLTSGTPVNITAIITLPDLSWTQDEVLKLEGTNGIIMTSATTTLNEHDLITFNSKTYEVVNLETIYAQTTAMFKHANLLLKS